MLISAISGRHRRVIRQSLPGISDWRHLAGLPDAGLTLLVLRGLKIIFAWGGG